MRKQKSARIFWVVLTIITLVIAGYCYYQDRQTLSVTTTATQRTVDPNSNLAIDRLESLSVKPAETGDDYERANFSSGWSSWRSCNVRQKILNRDIRDAQVADNGCTVIKGTLNDPYSGQEIELSNKTAVSKKVQIDHVVALSNAWQTGARYLSADERKQLANDDLELIAVSSSANQDKSDGDASEWLPENQSFQCAYIARQIAVKLKYRLWVTTTEKAAMINVLNTCPDEPLPAE
ncbi:MAG: HNH endonuclease family protein [Candidatus Saccharibacteria bacterium]|nr:HNH endonuclease family protein [Candidatus Saccharibacteria bacterium]